MPCIGAALEIALDKTKLKEIEIFCTLLKHFESSDSVEFQRNKIVRLTLGGVLEAEIMALSFARRTRNTLETRAITFCLYQLATR